MKSYTKNLFFFAAFFLPFILTAQDCEGYFPAKEGSVSTMTNYNEKGKVESIVTMTLKEKIVAGDAVTLKCNSVSTDDKGKQTFSTDFNVTCINNDITIDMRNMIPSESMAAYQGMEIEIEGGNLPIPAGAKPGDKLPDGHLIMKVSTGGMTLATITTDVTDRMVEKTEKITTAAGSFDCIKINQNVHMKVLFKMEGSSSEWYSKKSGLIRSESFDNKGKMTGYSELTSIK